LPDTSSGNRRRPSAVKYFFSPQINADQRRQKILGKENELKTGCFLAGHVVRRPSAVEIILFTAD
jgi:hypothetical protein